MSSQHILREFDKGMESLKADVLLMASLTRQNLERAMRALLERDIDLARTVIADDSDVDDLERKIDQGGMDILVRFHPVASDLRLVITSMKMAHNLERISDHAVNIAKRAKKICKAAPLEETALTEPLYTLADKLLRDASLLLTLSFFVSAVLNYALARYLLRSPAGSEAFNTELAKMNLWSWPVIVLPSMAMTMFALWRLLGGIQQVTGLELEQLMHGAPAKK